MYKVLIADDEEWIREGLKTFIDWNKMGFSVVGEAEDGRQALELVNELQPHVVLTDIRMPFSTGIELMENVRKHNKTVKFVILSGFNEFEYANAAIDSGASGYLLKPINVDKLKDVFGKVKQEFDLSGIEDMRKKQAFRLLREEFVTKLVHGKPEVLKQLPERAAEAGVYLGYNAFTVLLVEVDELNRILAKYSAADLELLLYALKNMAEELFQSASEVSFFNWQKAGFGMLVAHQAGAPYPLPETADLLIAKAAELLKLRVTIYIGATAADPYRIQESFRRAAELTKLKFFYGKNRRITEEEQASFLANAHSARNKRTTVQAERLLALVQEAGTEELGEYVETTFAGIWTREESVDVYAQFMRIAAKLKEKYHPLFSHVEPMKEQDFFDMRHMETMEELKASINELYAEMIRRLGAKGIQTPNKMMDQLIAFMESHYAEDITLETAAERVFMHPMYVSKWFKKETGKNFVDYLTEIRIAKAKEFLGDYSLKIYAVSDMVGYSDPKYFSKVFKQAVGVTPKEYRKLVLGYMDDLFEM